MPNDDKFAKIIEDENLDAVAGGTIQEFQKDIKFFNALGADMVRKQRTLQRVKDTWEGLGIENKISDNPKVKNQYFKDGKEISRNDAMIYAMRTLQKYADLERFI